MNTSDYNVVVTIIKHYELLQNETRLAEKQGRVLFNDIRDGMFYHTSRVFRKIFIN